METVAVVDRDNRGPAAPAEALDSAQRDAAVLGRLADVDPELALERLDDALRAETAHDTLVQTSTTWRPIGSTWSMS